MYILAVNVGEIACNEGADLLTFAACHQHQHAVAGGLSQSFQRSSNREQNEIIFPILQGQRCRRASPISLIQLSFLIARRRKASLCYF